jgi:hypothetical protein
MGIGVDCHGTMRDNILHVFKLSKWKRINIVQAMDMFTCNAAKVG